MKLHVNLPKSYSLEATISKITFSTLLFENTETRIIILKVALKKIKSGFIKLLPNHWFDSIWDDLDFKI